MSKKEELLKKAMHSLRNGSMLLAHVGWWLIMGLWSLVWFCFWFLWFVIMAVNLFENPEYLPLAVLPVVCLFFERTRLYLAVFLVWLMCPIGFPFAAERNEWIKARWKSMLLAVVHPVIMLVWFSLATAGEDRPNGAPVSTDVYSAKGLYEATGVDFPEVIPVDSSSFGAFRAYVLTVKFVPKQKLSEAFYERLDEACEQDTLHWHKNSDMYIFEKGRGGEHFVHVYVPEKGDTITVSSGKID